MPAFNGRFVSKKIGHVPLMAIVGSVGLLFSIMPSFLFPMPFNFFFMALAVVSFITAFVGFTFGDDLPFLRIKYLAWREKDLVTSETWTDE